MAKIVFYMIFKPQSNRSGLYVNNATLRLNRNLNPQPEPQPDRSLYINIGDVTQTAAVQTAAVCLGHNGLLYYLYHYNVTVEHIYRYHPMLSLETINFVSQACMSTMECVLYMYTTLVD